MRDRDAASIGCRRGGERRPGVGAIRRECRDEIASARGPFLDRERPASHQEVVVRRPPIVRHDDLIMHPQEFPAQASVQISMDHVAQLYLPWERVAAPAAELDTSRLDRIEPAAEYVLV